MSSVYERKKPFKATEMMLDTAAARAFTLPILQGFLDEHATVRWE